ncbi:MAG: hypothetical protein AAB425_02000 [Bdellovibrionota bacterium]
MPQEKPRSKDLGKSKAAADDAAGYAKIDDFLTRFGLAAAFGNALSKTFDLVRNQEKKARDLMEVFQTNPALGDFVLKLDFLKDRVSQWTAEEGPEAPVDTQVFLARILGLLGKPASRNLIVNLSLLRRLKGALPRGEKDRILLLPSEQLKYAIASEAYCEDRGLAHPERAFEAGYHYDWILTLLAEEKGGIKKIPPDLLVYVQAMFNRSLLNARCAYGLAGLTKDFYYEREVFAATHLLGCGRMLMYIAFPKELDSRSWLAFVNECEKLKPRAARFFQLRETERFGFSHSLPAALLSSITGRFPGAEVAIANWKNPFFLKSVDADQYRLATIVGAGVSLAEWIGSNDPPAQLPDYFQPHQITGLKGMGIPEANLKVLGERARKELTK